MFRTLNDDNSIDYYCVVPQAQVASIQEESAKLQAAYAGDKAMEITNREREVLRAWMELQVGGTIFHFFWSLYIVMYCFSLLPASFLKWCRWYAS